ncbi:exonuclease domain-containing protein [Ferrimonas pelagia]|uniref:Exonuclease domain-containing protein n=1 Tax=Ferrimonas pelagia TaxID=1177826 RepID=A0ABP9ENS3_9GAMM
MISALRFRWAQLRNRSTELAPYYRAGRADLARDYRQARMLALDLELTGLDPQQDQILSIGCVPIEQGRLQLSQAHDQVVLINGEVGDSCTIHGIRDRDMAAGIPLAQALSDLIPMLAGRVLICHNARLDLAFLQQGLRRCFGQGLPLMAVDTLSLELKRFAQRDETPKADALQLGRCRARYELPNYPGHHALVDAIACGELLLAQASAMSGRHTLSLGRLLR